MRWTRLNRMGSSCEYSAMDEVAAPTATLEFDAYYSRVYGRVLTVSLAVTGDRRSAEDLTQEAFLAALEQWDRVSGLDEPIAWVCRVVVNRSVSLVRRRIVEARSLARLRGRRHLDLELPSSSVEFWEAVRRLPRRQREVVALFYVADLPVTEVADAIGCAEGTVKAHLHAARRSLATELELEVGDG